MSSVIQNIFGIILNVEFLIGILGNGFIALVNCVDWVKRRKISLVDQILTGLALSRIGMLWSNIIYLLIPVLYPGLMINGNMVRIIYNPWMVTNHFSLWLATSLSIFYFLKIANFSHSLFLYLRWRVTIVISGTLLVSLVLLFLNIVLTNTEIDVWNSGYKGNLSYSSSLSSVAHLFNLLLIINTMFMLPPFIVSLMTFLLLIFSLWKHLKRMQHNARGSRDASTTAHVKALQTVIAFLLLYAVYFLSHFVQVWMCIEGSLISFVWAIGTAFPSGHSFILILGNSKLRQVSQSVLWWLRCRSKDVEPVGP